MFSYCRAFVDAVHCDASFLVLRLVDTLRVALCKYHFKLFWFSKSSNILSNKFARAAACLLRMYQNSVSLTSLFNMLI